MTKMNADKSIEVIKTDDAGPPAGPYYHGTGGGKSLNNELFLVIHYSSFDPQAYVNF
jgi:hypothetical protein